MARYQRLSAVPAFLTTIPPARYTLTRVFRLSITEAHHVLRALRPDQTVDISVLTEPINTGLFDTFLRGGYIKGNQWYAPNWYRTVFQVTGINEEITPEMRITYLRPDQRGIVGSQQWLEDLVNQVDELSPRKLVVVPYFPTPQAAEPEAPRPPHVVTKQLKPTPPPVTKPAQPMPLEELKHLPVPRRPGLCAVHTLSMLLSEAEALYALLRRQDAGERLVEAEVHQLFGPTMTKTLQIAGFFTELSTSGSITIPSGPTIGFSVTVVRDEKHTPERRVSTSFSYGNPPKKPFQMRLEMTLEKALSLVGRTLPKPPPPPAPAPKTITYLCMTFEEAEAFKMLLALSKKQKVVDTEMVRSRFDSTLYEALHELGFLDTIPTTSSLQTTQGIPTSVRIKIVDTAAEEPRIKRSKMRIGKKVQSVTGKFLHVYEMERARRAAELKRLEQAKGRKILWCLRLTVPEAQALLAVLDGATSQVLLNAKEALGDQLFDHLVIEKYLVVSPENGTTTIAMHRFEATLIRVETPEEYAFVFRCEDIRAEEAHAKKPFITQLKGVLKRAQARQQSTAKPPTSKVTINHEIEMTAKEAEAILKLHETGPFTIRDLSRSTGGRLVSVFRDVGCTSTIKGWFNTSLLEKTRIIVRAKFNKLQAPTTIRSLEVEEQLEHTDRNWWVQNLREELAHVQSQTRTATRTTADQTTAVDELH